MLGYSGDNKIKSFLLLFLAPRSFLYFTLFLFLFLSFLSHLSTPPIRNKYNYQSSLTQVEYPLLHPIPVRPVTISLPFSLSLPPRSISRLFLSILSSLFPLLVRCSCPWPPPSLLPLLSLSAPRRNRSPPTPAGSLTTSRNRATNPYSAS